MDQHLIKQIVAGIGTAGMQVNSLREALPIDTSSSSGSGTLEARVVALENRLSRLSLISQALWELLRERESLAEDLLALKVAEIDLRDGRLDGKARTTPQPCPKCQRVLQSGAVRCLYCGEASLNENVFRGL